MENGSTETLSKWAISMSSKSRMKKGVSTKEIKA
jgi:hypothetical protein